MSQFLIKDTAFAGYRLLAARPGVALAWFAFSLAVVLGMAVLTVSMAGPQLTALKEMQASGSRDAATLMTLTGQIFPFTVLSMILPLFTGAILMAAIARAVLRPQEKALGYLRLGADELRLFVVSIVITLVFFAPIILAYGGGMIGLFAVAGPRTAAMAMQGAGEMPVAAMVAAAAAAVPGLALFIFFYVKLSLAAPQTVAERAIRIFNSWSLTKGVFWRALGVYVLAAIPAVLGYVALMAAVVALKGDDGDWKTPLQPDVSSMAAAFSGLQIGVYVLQALLQTVYTAALLVPAALIYTAVSERPAEATDDEAEGDDD